MTVFQCRELRIFLCFRVLYIADNILCFDVIGEQDDNYISCHKIQFTLYLSLSKSQRIWNWAKTEMLKIQRNRFSSKWQSQWSNKWKEHKECDQVIRKGQYIMSYIWHPLWSSSSQWQSDINKFMNTIYTFNTKILWMIWTWFYFH